MSFTFLTESSCDWMNQQRQRKDFKLANKFANNQMFKRACFANVQWVQECTQHVFQASWIQTMYSDTRVGFGKRKHKVGLLNTKLHREQG